MKSMPQQLVSCAVAVWDVHVLAGAFDDSVQAGNAQQLVHIVQRVSCYPVAC